MADDDSWFDKDYKPGMSRGEYCSAQQRRREREKPARDLEKARVNRSIQKVVDYNGTPD